MSDDTSDRIEDLNANVDPNDYEEISSEEVDRVVEMLDHLIEGVQSENIKHLLEEAASNIYYLVYEDESDHDVLDQAA